MLPPKISSEEAVKIIREQQGKPYAVVAAYYRGDWWDLRGMSEWDRRLFLLETLSDIRRRAKNTNVTL